MLWNYLQLLEEIHWHDLVDIGLATLLLWFAIHALRTSRTRKVGLGLLLFGGLLLAADKLSLKLSGWILQGVTAVVILILVVVYQNEIRRLIERLPAGLRSRNTAGRQVFSGRSELLIHALETLSVQNRGALIVLPGKEPLADLITRGVPLDGLLSKALLLSIFDPNSPGHDGALILRGERIERFGCRLPLSERDEQLKERGTRHAAALGLAEKTDALVLVVSEESGRISLAEDGRLTTVTDLAMLRPKLQHWLGETEGPQTGSGRFGVQALWSGLEVLAALVIAAFLWLVLVPGSVVGTATYAIPVEVQNIPAGYTLTSVTPATVAVTLSGEKRRLFQINAEELVIRLDGTLTSFGRQTFPITAAHILLPPDVELADLTPEQVRVQVSRQP